MKRFIAVLSGILILPAFADNDFIVITKEIMENCALTQPKTLFKDCCLGRPLDSSSTGTTPNTNNNNSGTSEHFTNNSDNISTIVNLTQDTYNTDVLDYRNVNLSGMSEQQACLYWKAEWIDNTCVLRKGPGKDRFELRWNSQQKKFECLNFLEAERDIDQEILDYYFDPSRSTWLWDNAQWDPVIEECGSQSERDCRDADNAWHYETGVCYLSSKNKNMCESVGAKFHENENGSQSCDCVLADNTEFHWNSTERDCDYKVYTDSHGSYRISSAGGWISGSQHATVESCIEGLIKKGFLQRGEVLQCQ